MHAVITDLSSLEKEKIILLMRTSTTSALRFSLSYHLQPPGYFNGVGEVEVAAEHATTHTRATHATILPDETTITGLAEILHYFQYAREHLTTQRGAPLLFARWIKSRGK